MVCLIKSQHKEDLKHYANILGSEEAAYYVLAMNNGYTLDKTPDGEVSSLYTALLTVTNGDEEQAIILKSAVYTPLFIGTTGDWTYGFDTNNGSTEPSISQLTANQQLCDNTAIQSILNDPALADSLAMAELSNMLQRDEFIRSSINSDRELYINSELAKTIWQHAQGTPEQAIEEQNLRIKLGIEYDDDLRSKALTWLETELLTRFDDVQFDGLKFVGTGEVGLFRAKLLNSLYSMTTSIGLVTGNKTDLALAAVSLIKAYLSNMPADSAIHPFIVQYLRLMSDSKEMQDAFGILKAENKNASIDSMIDQIAEYVEGRIMRSPTKLKLITSILKIVERLVNSVRWLIPGLSKKDYNTRRNMLDAITIFFTANENLSHSLNSLLQFDINLWKINDGKLDMTEMKVIKRMKDGIEARIKSVKSVQSNGVFDLELSELEEWLRGIDDLLQSTKSEDKGEQQIIIRKFLVNAIVELLKASIELANMQNNPADNIDSQALMHIKTDIVGFYENIVSLYVVPLTRHSDDPELLAGGQLYNAIITIDKVLNVVKHTFNYQLERFCDNWIDKMIDENLDIGDIELFRMNAKLWARNRINNGDLPTLEKFFGSAISSQSPIVRMLDIQLREVNLEAHQLSLAVGKKLLILYERAKPLLNSISFYNFMNEFIEKDKNGKRTGYFVSEVNLGEFLRLLKVIEDKLDKKYNIQIDPLGGRVFEDDDQWRQYHDELDRETEAAGGHKLYKAAYYIARRNHLSRDTIQLYDRIRTSINKILETCTETINGKKIINIAKLSPEGHLKYRLLKTIQQQMSNPYEVVFDLNTGQVVSIKLKQGDALRMAIELTEWNKVKRDHIKYNNNQTKFDEDRAELVAKYGDNSHEVSLFDYEFSSLRISNAFYIQLEAILGKSNLPKDLENLLNRRTALHNLAYRKRGFYMPDLDLLSDDVFAELKSLDLLISDEFNKLGKKLTKDLFELLLKLRSKPYVKRLSTNETYYTWLQNNSGLSPQLFADKYTYRNAKGVITPLSIFQYTYPTLPHYISTVLSGPYSDIDISNSDWVDQDYDTNNEDKILPDKVRYANPQYTKLTKDNKSPVYKFYKELLSVNDQIWENLDGVRRPNRFLMPQRRASNSRLITRKGFWSNTKAMISNSWSINERDTDYNEEFAKRPDGSIVETIPLRWINKLEDPNTIDTNIILSITDMLEMSILYKYKKAMLPTLEAINFLLFGGFSDSPNKTPSDLSQRYKTHMSMYMYGRMRTGFKNDKKITGTEKFLMRLADKANAVAHAKLMAHNIRSVFKNFLDSLFSVLSEVNSGRNFTYTDAKRAARNMGAELRHGGAFASLGRVKVPTMTAGLMQYNKISGSVDEIFDGLDLGWIRRIIKNHFCMGEYTAIDYNFKGFITEMVYSSYRLMTNPNTGKKEYLNRQLAQYMYVKAGFDIKQGLAAYNKTTETLRDAYEFDQYGRVKIKDSYLDYVCPIKDGTNGLRSKKLELRVATTIAERCAVINGMLDQMDRNAASQNYVGATVLLMRGWLVSQQIDYQKRGHDFAIYSDDDELITKDGALRQLTMKYTDSALAGILEEDPRYTGLFNFGTGTIDNGMWVSLLNAYTQWTKGVLTLNATGALDKLNDQQRIQIRRMNACILSVLILCASTFFLGSLWEDDPDNWVWAFLYNGALAAMTERFTLLGPIGLLFVLVDIIKTPAVASALIQDIKYIPAALKDMAALAWDKVTGDQQEGEMYETVNSGSLKGLTNWLRDLMKASSTIPYVNQLGIENMYKSYFSINAYKSSTNWYGGVAPNPILAYIPRFGKNAKNKGIYSWLLQEDDTESNKKPNKKSQENLYYFPQ